MTVSAQRPPRLVMSTTPGRTQYAVVICSGTRRPGHACNRPLGEVNTGLAYDVQFRCHDCRSVYELQRFQFQDP